MQGNAPHQQFRYQRMDIIHETPKPESPVQGMDIIEYYPREEKSERKDPLLDMLDLFRGLTVTTNYRKQQQNPCRLTFKDCLISPNLLPFLPVRNETYPQKGVPVGWFTKLAAELNRDTEENAIRENAQRETAENEAFCREFQGLSVSTEDSPEITPELITEPTQLKINQGKHTGFKPFSIFEDYLLLLLGDNLKKVKLDILFAGMRQVRSLDSLSRRQTRLSGLSPASRAYLVDFIANRLFETVEFHVRLNKYDGGIESLQRIEAQTHYNPMDILEEVLAELKRRPYWDTGSNRVEIREDSRVEEDEGIINDGFLSSEGENEEGNEGVRSPR